MNVSIQGTEVLGFLGFTAVIGVLLLNVFGFSELYDYGVRGKHDDDKRRKKDKCCNGRKSKLAIGWILYVAGLILAGLAFWAFYESSYAKVLLPIIELGFLLILIGFSVMNNKSSCCGCRGEKKKKCHDSSSSSSSSETCSDSSSNSSSNESRDKVRYSGVSSSSSSS